MSILIQIVLGVVAIVILIFLVYIIAQIQMKGWLKQFDRHLDKNKDDGSIKK